MNRRHPRIATLIALIAGLLLAPISVANAAVLPTAPTAITATAGPASIDLTWAAPAYPGSGVTTYSVEYATSTDTTTWTMASNTISSSATSYSITPLTSGVKYFVRMAALNAGTPGPYGYPWTQLYSTSSPQRNSSGAIIYDANYGLGAGDTATNLISAAKTFTRVKYRLEYRFNAATVYADADMAKWNESSLTNTIGTYTSSAATISNLRIPSTDAGNTFQIHTNVQDLTVVSSDSSINVSNKVGRLEIWPWNYSPGYSNLLPQGNSGVYDFDDYPSIASTYGSFQVHNATNAATVLAWNNHSYGTTADIGIGTGSTPDWTFLGSAGITNFRLMISINIPVTPTTPLNSSVTLNTPANTIFRSSTTLTAAISTTGKVTFIANGKRIPGCVSVQTVTNTGVSPNTYSATCAWKPASRGAISLSATFTPTAGPISSFKLSTPTITENRTSKR
jgi:hypothetical protein